VLKALKKLIQGGRGRLLERGRKRFVSLQERREFKNAASTRPEEGAGGPRRQAVRLEQGVKMEPQVTRDWLWQHA